MGITCCVNLGDFAESRLNVNHVIRTSIDVLGWLVTLVNFAFLLCKFAFGIVLTIVHICSVSFFLNSIKILRSGFLCISSPVND